MSYETFWLTVTIVFFILSVGAVKLLSMIVDHLGEISFSLKIIASAAHSDMLRDMESGD